MQINTVNLTIRSQIKNIPSNELNPRAGAISSFFGTTRDTFENKVVTHLEYEAYPEMAQQCMLDICDKIRSKWDVLNIAIQHKLGPCPVLETSVAIVVSSAHRTDSLEAVHFAIDELKRMVPIWKKVSDGNYGLHSSYS